MNARDYDAECWARDLVRKMGYTDALRHAERMRDCNAPATVSFSHHNRVVKQLKLFATVGIAGTHTILPAQRSTRQRNSHA